MKILLLLTLSLVVQAQTVTLSNPILLSGDQFNFYNQVDATFITNSTLAVFDKGNLTIHVIDLKTKTSTATFGKGGQGPGELNKWMRIYTMNELIFMISGQRILGFDQNGSLISEKKQNLNPRNLYFDSESNTIRMISVINQSLTLLEFDSEFQILNQTENILGSHYVPMANRTMDYGTLYKQPNAFMPYADGIIGFYKGKFKAFNLKDGQTEMTFYSEDVARQKLPDDFDMGIEGPRDNPQFKAMIAKLNAYIIQESNGYEDDIQEIVGVYSKYAIFRIISQKDNHLSFIFVDLDKANPSQIINIPYYNSENFSLNQTRLNGNKLILSTKDDVNGASVLIYTIDQN